jgi:hypothetical protein
MSKHIPYVEDVKIETPDGTPLWRDEEGNGNSDQFAPPKAGEAKGKERPRFTRSQLGFMLDRTTDPEFGKGLPGWEAADRAYGLREELRAQMADAKMRGYWTIKNDDDAERLQNAAKEFKWPESSAALAFNYVPFVRAIRAQAPPPVAVANVAAE